MTALTQPSNHLSDGALGSLASGDKVQHPQGQAAGAVAELDQGPLPTGAAIAAGAAGDRDLPRLGTLDGDELAGQVAARQPEDHAAVGQQRRRGVGGDDTGAQLVADPLAVGIQLVVKDDLIAKGEGRVGVALVVGGDGREGAEDHVEVSVVALAVLGSAAWEAAEAAITPARVSTRAAAVAVSASFGIVFPLLAAGPPDVGVRLV